MRKIRKIKKAQAEGIGLVMIVAFLVFAMLIAMVYFVSQQKKSLVAEHTMNSLTANFLTSMFRTTTGCGSYSITELAIDCSFNPPTIDCGGISDSCGFMNETISNIFNQTLNKWNERYKFDISGLNQTIYFEHGDCENISAGGGSTPSTLPIPVVDTGKTLYATLTLCR
ncbi:MAG: hypothetical protein WC755_03430 [Candidatus Woesearchaeota archaeon]|jgi:hypothetical protein